MRASRGLKWENKMYKLKRSIIETVEKWKPEDILRNLTNVVLVDKLDEFKGFYPFLETFSGKVTVFNC